MGTSLAEMASNKYVSFTTFTKSGERKSTPVWIVDTGDIIGFNTQSDSWKVRRLKANSDCELTPCDQKGKVTEGGDTVTGSARLATPDEYTQIRAAVLKKYGVMARAFQAAGWLGAKIGKNMNDAAVVITSR